MDSCEMCESLGEDREASTVFDMGCHEFSVCEEHAEAFENCTKCPDSSHFF